MSDLGEPAAEAEQLELIEAERAVAASSVDRSTYRDGDGSERTEDDPEQDHPSG